ncbi:MAG: glutathione S-transferase family protein [Alphaproteobacteria bacterium]|nr:glutathione S-transferase family protein [Alphaproteobacteria bacterium]
MKLYDFGPAANAKRVRMFLAEKGIEIPIVEVQVRDGALFEEPYRTMNPFAVVPFLELDDGTVIGESMAICKYLEELHPEPSLLGRDARERALIEMWNRRLEIDGLMPMIHAVRNTNPLFAGRVVPGTRTGLAQLPEIAERGKAMLMILLERIDPALKDNAFIAGERFSIADITGFFMMNAAKILDVPFAEHFPNVTRWHADLASRPSAEA